VRKLKTVAKPPEASLPRGGTRFLFIGRYEYNKGPDILVEAMRLVLDKGNRTHLYLFGVGSLEARLRERTKGYESYIHLGGYADPNTVIRYMTACDWLIIPSRIESIPLVFVDALQMHLPVIATEVGDMGALIRRFGIGQVVQSAAPNSLAVAMEKAVSISRADIVGAWDEALNVFDLGQSARKCIDALTDAQTMSSKSTASVL
jgi:glycosyltransferase involved in cell wall biosynthesis